MTTKTAVTMKKPLSSRVAIRKSRWSDFDGVSFVGHDELVAYLKDELAIDDGVRHTSKELRHNLSREVGIYRVFLR